MRAGELRHRIKIHHSTVDPNAPDSTGQVTPNDETFADRVPAEVLEVSGGETLRGGMQVRATTSHVVRLRYQPGISEEMWITVYDGDWARRVLNVTHVRDRDGRRRELWLECREGK